MNTMLSANNENVFQLHQYYRLWTSLFVHADTGHLFSNLVLFIPLVYLLAAYFGTWSWPLGAVLAGGFINAIVLRGMSSTVFLVGISGVVNFLGGGWLTLYYFIDHRDQHRRRFAVVLFVTLVLFVPDTYKPEVSYASHLVGFFMGIVTAIIFYRYNLHRFKSAEVFKEVFEEEAAPQIDMSNL